MPASRTYTLLACSALALLSCLGSVTARPGIFNAAKGIQIKVIANPGNSCADVGEGQTCACACTLLGASAGRTQGTRGP